MFQENRLKAGRFLCWIWYRRVCLIGDRKIGERVVEDRGAEVVVILNVLCILPHFDVDCIIDVAQIFHIFRCLCDFKIVDFA